MASEEAIVRKLIADGDGASEDKRICQLIQLIQSLHSEIPQKELKSIYNKILILIDQIDFTFKKQVLVASAIELETENYEKMLLSIVKEKEIEQSEARMAKIKEELVQAKQIRKNRQEYDVLAKMIKEKPSRAESAIRLKALQEELDQALEKQKQLEQKLIDHRRNMCSLAIILNNINETNNAEDDQIVLDADDDQQPSLDSTTSNAATTTEITKPISRSNTGTVLNQLMQ